MGVTLGGIILLAFTVGITVFLTKLYMSRKVQKANAEVRALESENRDPSPSSVVKDLSLAELPAVSRVFELPGKKPNHHHELV